MVKVPWLRFPFGNRQNVNNYRHHFYNAVKRLWNVLEPQVDRQSRRNIFGEKMLNVGRHLSTSISRLLSDKSISNPSARLAATKHPSTHPKNKPNISLWQPLFFPFLKKLKKNGRSGLREMCTNRWLHSSRSKLGELSMAVQ